MKFTKNMMGIVSTLILVILLTQSRFFDFLTETPLGRMVLLAFIILIAYTNKILGLLAVLSIIIAFNQYDVNVYEGLKIQLPSKNRDEVAGQAEELVQRESEETVAVLKRQAEEAKRKAEEAETLQKKLEEAKKKVQKIADKPSSSVLKSIGGREGFCMTDRESTMLRGKQSNTIPVFNNSREQDDDISPSDKSIFSGSFSLF